LDTVHWHVAMQGMVNEIISTIRESRNPELKVEKFEQDGEGASERVGRTEEREQGF
jgi:hypothetical protein